MTENNTTFLYFAYGSNMLTRRLHERTPSAIAKDVGYVSRRRLTFDKVSSDGSGKCDIESTSYQDDRVYGVVFEIARKEKEELDKAEGRGKGYCEEQVVVISSSGSIEALTYVATKKEPALLPYHWYKALVVAGAVEHTLPTPYVEWLRTVNSIVDPNVRRRAEKEALLFYS
jgi:cation transport regulator ChaC